VDLLVVNDVSAPSVGFEHATNEVTLFDRFDNEQTISLRSKESISYEILDRVVSLLSQGAS
jgi:phosphopantothenoylcysteine synthetase/decarboxylase